MVLYIFEMINDILMVVVFFLVEIYFMYGLDEVVVNLNFSKN